MAGFTKLHTTILDSSLWEAPWPIKGVWITMLAMADCQGEIMTSLPGLARRATVSVEDCERAINVFLSPDPFSRTPDSEGRRIEAVTGGWRLLNYLHYRMKGDPEDRRRQNREAQQRHRASAIVSNDQQQSAPSAEAEAEANADIKYSSNSQPRPKKRPAAVRSKSENSGGKTLDEILGDCKLAYWAMVDTFGGQSKNYSPVKTATLFVEAVKSHTAELILAKAQGLRASVEDAKFLPQLEKWLEGQGYLNPDSPASRRAASIKGSSRLDKATEDYKRGKNG